MYQERMNSSLDNVENLWLGSQSPYLTGTQISVADLFAACEIEQVGKWQSILLVEIIICSHNYEY